MGRDEDCSRSRNLDYEEVSHSTHSHNSHRGIHNNRGHELIQLREQGAFSQVNVKCSC